MKDREAASMAEWESNARLNALMTPACKGRRFDSPPDELLGFTRDPSSVPEPTPSIRRSLVSGEEPTHFAHGKVHFLAFN